MRKTESLDSKSAAALFRRMDRVFGDLHWWPGKTRFEIILGAILTQNTAWTNVEQCIRNLKRQRLLSLHGIRSVSLEKLGLAIRPSGYFRQKSRKLKTFIRFLDREFGGSLRRMARMETPLLRNRLLSVSGIGPETADSILLYAFGKPVFVVDAYTRRIFSRLGFLDGEEKYEEIRSLFESAVREGVANGEYRDLGPRPGVLPGRVFNQYHALIVNTAKDFCRSKNPRCAHCPLNGFSRGTCLF